MRRQAATVAAIAVVSSVLLLGGVGTQPAVAAVHAQFSFSPATPYGGQTVSFDGSTTADDSGNPAYDFYSWNFGDGTSDFGARTNHQFDSAGSYMVTLTVTNDNGDTDRATQQVNVTDAPSETATSGQVEARFSYDAPDNRFSPVSITIVRAGRVAFSAQLDPICADCSVEPAGYYSHQPSVHAGGLDRDAEPEIVLDLSNGGNICCRYTIVYAYDPAAGTYRASTHNWGDSASGPLRDLNGDGVPEWRSSDGRIRYVFGCGGCVPYPIQIVRFEHGRFIDVTRQFPSLVAQDAARDWRIYKRHGRFEQRGALAAWVADQYSLGRSRRAWRAVRQAARAGHLRCRGRFDDPCGHGYVRTLRKWLHKHGYG